MVPEQGGHIKTYPEQSRVPEYGNQLTGIFMQGYRSFAVPEATFINEQRAFILIDGRMSREIIVFFMEFYDAIGINGGVFAVKYPVAPGKEPLLFLPSELCNFIAGFCFVIEVGF